MDQITSSFLASPLAVDLPARMQLSADTLAFTHTSKHKAKHQQFEAEDDEDQDYERLEHLGDAVLGFIVTELIGELFPRLTVGAATVLKSRLVNNRHSLAQLSLYYRLPNSLQGSATQIDGLRRTESVQADIFESYLAASMKEHGLDAVKTWTRSVFTPLAKIHHDDMKVNDFLRGAIPDGGPTGTTSEATQTSPLYDPTLAPPFFAPTQPTSTPQPHNSYIPPIHPFTETFTQPNPVDISYVPFLELWQTQSKTKGRAVEFTFGPRLGQPHMPTFTCECEVKGWRPAEDRQVFFGRGSTKKIAKNRAAQEAVEKMGLRQY